MASMTVDRSDLDRLWTEVNAMGKDVARAVALLETWEAQQQKTQVSLFGDGDKTGLLGRVKAIERVFERGRWWAELQMRVLLPVVYLLILLGIGVWIKETAAQSRPVPVVATQGVNQ